MRALHRSSAAVLVVCALTGGAAVAAGTGFPAPLPAKAKRILDHDWCSPRSYTKARNVKGVTKRARRALVAAEKVAMRHKVGCQIAERFAQRMKAGKFPSGVCPVNPAPLMPGGASAAGAAAARFVGRAQRPVIAGYGSRIGQVRNACGPAVADRTITVSLSLTALLPSASLSERNVAVSHVHGGWRVWLVLH